MYKYGDIIYGSYLLKLRPLQKPEYCHDDYHDTPVTQRSMENFVDGHIEFIYLGDTECVMGVKANIKKTLDGIPVVNQYATRLARQYKAIGEEDVIIGNAFIAAVINNKVSTIPGEWKLDWTLEE